MRSARKSEFFGTKAKAIGSASFDHHERLHGLDGGARIDRGIDVTQTSTRRPSASTTATAPLWRLSTRPPRVTSTRAGLPIFNEALCFLSQFSRKRFISN